MDACNAKRDYIIDFTREIEMNPTHVLSERSRIDIVRFFELASSKQVAFSTHQPSVLQFLKPLVPDGQARCDDDASQPGAAPMANDAAPNDNGADSASVASPASVASRAKRNRGPKQSERLASAIEEKAKILQSTDAERISLQRKLRDQKEQSDKKYASIVQMADNLRQRIKALQYLVTKGATNDPAAMLSRSNSSLTASIRAPARNESDLSTPTMRAHQLASTEQSIPYIEIWIFNSLRLPQQGNLGKVGSGWIELVDDTHHLCFWKRTYVGHGDLSPVQLEYRTLEILRIWPNIHVHKVFGLAGMQENARGKKESTVQHPVEQAYVVHVVASEFIRGANLHLMLVSHLEKRGEEPNQHYSRDLAAVSPFNQDSSRSKMVAIKQLLRGVQHLHQHGIAHRDIHPANLMIISQDIYRWWYDNNSDMLASAPSPASLHASAPSSASSSPAAASSSSPAAASSSSSADRTMYVDGFYPHADLDGRMKVHSAMTGLRLVIVDFNSALPVMGATLSEMKASWNCGTTDYSAPSFMDNTHEDGVPTTEWSNSIHLMTKRLEDESAAEGNGDEQMSHVAMKRRLTVMWYQRDHYSLALTMMTMLRGVPSQVKKEKINDEEVVNAALLSHVRAYNIAKLKKRMIPSIADYLLTQELVASHWWWGEHFITANEAMKANMMNSEHGKKVKAELQKMTTLYWAKDCGDSADEQTFMNAINNSRTTSLAGIASLLSDSI